MGGGCGGGCGRWRSCGGGGTEDAVISIGRGSGRGSLLRGEYRECVSQILEGGVCVVNEGEVVRGGGGGGVIRGGRRRKSCIVSGSGWSLKRILCGGGGMGSGGRWSGVYGGRDPLMGRVSERIRWLTGWRERKDRGRFNGMCRVWIAWKSGNGRMFRRRGIVWRRRGEFWRGSTW